MLITERLNSPLFSIYMRYGTRRNGKSRKAKTAKYAKKNGAASTHSNEGVNQKATEKKQEQPKEETPEEKIVRKAYELAPEWKISQSARKKFMNLPSSLQNSTGKEACIKESLSSHKEWIPDPTRYWIWLIDETNKLTRVWDFKETCEKSGLDPQTVAQHLILEGKMVCNAIRMEGLEAYGSNIRMFVDPLFVDEFNFFGNKKKEVEND